jgi:fatty acid desaturase
MLGVFALFCATGHALDWFWLIYVPPRLGSLWLTIFFQWLPHHSFDHTERYRNTRISLWPGAEVLTLQQNLHLMHHLSPSVPFYNYGLLFRRLRPTLVAKGSRIEGLMVGRYARDKAGIGAGSLPRSARETSSR